MIRVDYRETLVTYLRADSLTDCAKTLGISKATLSARIKVLKKAGVNVPKITRSSGALTQLEVSQLNSLIIKHNKEAKKAY